MEMLGQVKNGVIVLQNGHSLSEGTKVKVVVEGEDSAALALREFLQKKAGCMTGLPADLADQHDHYLHGTPKR
ncbi:MAG: hypothetical protein ACJ8FY_23630 [Gemmataceae bacterium]